MSASTYCTCRGDDNATIGVVAASALLSTGALHVVDGAKAERGLANGEPVEKENGEPGEAVLSMGGRRKRRSGKRKEGRFERELGCAGRNAWPELWTAAQNSDQLLRLSLLSPPPTICSLARSHHNIIPAKPPAGL